MNFLGIILTVILSVIVVFTERRWAALALVAGACYITQGQEVLIIGFHFTAIRLILLAGFARSVARGELGRVKVNQVDKAVIVYAVVASLIFVTREASMEAFVGELGLVYNILLPYLVFRALLTGFDEVEIFLPALAVVIVPFALCLIWESVGGKNVFASFGGVGTMFRDGHYRAEGAFRSPITAGTFGATLMPLFAGVYLTGRRRSCAVLGLLATTTVVICSRSSGPLLAYGSGVMALLFWRWREQVRRVRWAILISIIALQLYMKAPVWFLMGHVSDIVGGGGWHRAEIVDSAIKNFGSWWFSGTNQTSNWVATELSFGGADLTNQFVAEGVHAGLVSMLLFIWIIVQCYRHLGLAMRRVREIAPAVEMILWALGSALFATVINFFSISYFDQIGVIWWFLVALISGASFAILNKDEPFRSTTFSVPPINQAEAVPVFADTGID